MPKIVCVECEIELKPEENGILLIEFASFGAYKAWYADLWKCPKCGTEIVSGFGNSPIMEHFQDGFSTWLEEARKKASRVVCDYEK